MVHLLRICLFTYIWPCKKNCVVLCFGSRISNFHYFPLMCPIFVGSVDNSGETWEKKMEIPFFISVLGWLPSLKFKSWTDSNSITFQDPLYITDDQRDKIEGVTSVQKNYRDLQPLGARKIMDVETGYRNFNAGYQALANSLIIGGMLFLTKFIWKWFDFQLTFLNFVTCTKFGIKKIIIKHSISI